MKMRGVRAAPPAMRTALRRTRLILWSAVFVVGAVTLLLRWQPDRLRDVVTTMSDPWTRLQSWDTTPLDVGPSRRLGAAPDVTLELFDGGTFRLAEQRGHVVVMNFWASWCIPCRREAPRLALAARQYHDRGVVLVGIAIQDSEMGARGFLKEFGITYPNGPDPQSALANAYSVASIPTTVVIDQQGQMRRRWLGELSAAQLTGFIDDALR